MRSHEPDGGGGRPAAIGSSSRLSLGLMVAALGGLLSLGLHPSASGSSIPMGPRPGAGGSTAGETGSPAADTLILSGAVPTASRARGVPSGSAACPAAVMDQLRHVFRWQMNFPHDLRPGDSFRAVMVRPGPPGEGDASARAGDRDVRVLGAEIETRGRPSRAVWYHGRDDAQRGYFEPDGTRVGASRIPTPDGFRMTSRFDWGRLHPVYRHRRPHLGVDYAVPYGEEVRAVAAGTVTEVARVPGFGLVVQIQHDAHRSTRYAHLSSVETGIVPGRSVDAGTTIGRAGATGVATAPHLHFELLLDGQQRNPLAQVAGGLPRTGPAADLPAFIAQRDRILQLLETGAAPDPTAARMLVAAPRRSTRSYTGAGRMAVWVSGRGPLPGSERLRVARWPLPPRAGGAGRAVSERPAEETGVAGTEPAAEPVCALGLARELPHPSASYVVTSTDPPDPAGDGVVAGVSGWYDARARSGG